MSPLGRSTLLVWLLIFLLLLCRKGWPEIPSENEVQYLAYVRQRAEPGWLSKDFVLGGRPVPYHFLYVEVGSLVSHLTSLHSFAVGLRLFNAVLFTAGFLFLARVLGSSPADVVLAFSAYLVLFSIPLFQAARVGVIHVTAEPYPTAWGFALLGAAAAISGRWFVAAALLGLASSAHVLVGAQLSLPFLVSAFLFAGSPQDRPAKRVIYGAAVTTVWLALASVGLFRQAIELVSRPISAEASIVYFERAAHHLDAQRFLPQLCAALALCGIGLLLRHLSKEKNYYRDDRCFVAAMIFVMSYCLVGLVLQSLGMYSLLKVYPYRTWPLVGIAAILYGVRELRTVSAYRVVSDRFSVWLGGFSGLGAGVLVVAMLAAATTFHAERRVRELMGISAKDESQNSPDTIALFRWIRDRTEPSGVFLTAPAFWWGDFQWKTDRGTVFQVKALPHDSDGMIEWKRRQCMLESAFDLSVSPEMRRERLGSALKELGADYAILRNGQDQIPPGWISDYENASFLVIIPRDRSAQQNGSQKDTAEDFVDLSELLIQRNVNLSICFSGWD